MAYRLTLAPWLKGYRPGDAAADGLAALIVTLMLIPQSLAYALVAGVPAQMGLYASILPLLAYALFGSSRTLAVGPVAVVSLMTAAAGERNARAMEPIAPLEPPSARKWPVVTSTPRTREKWAASASRIGLAQP